MKLVKEQIYIYIHMYVKTKKESALHLWNLENILVTMQSVQLLNDGEMSEWWFTSS